MSALPLEDEKQRPHLRVMSARRVAIILFNLGGPDEPEAVRPFLFNLFNDKAIISLPQPFRFMLAQLISRVREKLAIENYGYMGGASPILPETILQAQALEQAMAARVANVSFKCFPVMRYWAPRAKHVAVDVEAWGATDAILLPLYPQYSSTTTGSSLAEWRKVSALPASALCCYPTSKPFVEAHAEAIIKAWRDGGSPANPRVLFSAHSLPERVIAAGDPYQWQMEQTAAAVRALLPPEWETRICYQSRVGPIKWIGPTTEQEIHAAAQDGVGLIVTPIAFVSEHIETLVELDIEYAQVATRLGLPFYLRAAALGTAPRFIDALADLAAQALEQPGKTCSEQGARLCPAHARLCPHRSTD
ncbi:MAG TPA: ferrochelatase [Terricaulis sp.]|nr:ferrochelatase [Terricaulis sp.]